MQPTRQWMTPQERQIWRMVWAARFAAGDSTKNCDLMAGEAIKATRFSETGVAGQLHREAMGYERAELVGYKFPAGRGMTKTGGV